MDTKTPADVTSLWFSERVKPMHWKSTDAFDQELRDAFLATYEAACAGGLADWEDTPEGVLALVILLDQFSRNMFRGTARMYAADGLARRHVRRALERGFDKALTQEQRCFVYMPFMHSESTLDQQRAVELFSTIENSPNVRFAYLHKDIVDRFGRFPHRNKILGRVSTPEELVFLSQPGSGF